MVVTITTVGYGDIAPHSYFGRIILMVISIWGAFMISLIVLTVASVFQLSKNQVKAMGHIRVTKSGVKTIEAAFKFYKAKKLYYQQKDSC